jgi:hypothetical protein
MPLIDNTRNRPINTDYTVDNSKLLTADEVKARVTEVQTENIQAIQDAIEQNSAGSGDKVKIKVPADANGKAIHNPTVQDWENAAKNNRFVEMEDSPARLASTYYGVRLVDFGNAANNRVANGALLKELREALSKGITFPSTQSIPTSEIGDIVRAYQARQDALNKVKQGIGNPNAGTALPPSYAFEIKVPADAQGNPIKNPTTQDWIDAQTNNRWATVKGTSDQLAADYFGVKLELGGDWRTAYKDNILALDKSSDYGFKSFDAKVKIANGEFSALGLLDIPDAGRIIYYVLALLGPA